MSIKSDNSAHSLNLTVARTPHDSNVSNEAVKPHRNRKRGDRSKRDGTTAGKRNHDLEKSGRRTASLLEIKNLDRDQNDPPIKGEDGENVRESLGEGYQDVSSARRKRREKNRQRAATSSSRTVISTVLGDLIEEETQLPSKKLGDEDVLVYDWETPFAPPKMKNISNKQYVEQKSNKKFFPRDLEDLGDDECEHPLDQSWSPVNIAVSVQNCFRPMASLCCGFLGGISLWQCFTMLHWHSPYQESFMKYFPDSARAFHCMYYLFAVVSLVSVLDSCDLNCFTKRNFWYSFPCGTAPVVISITLIVSLAMSLICAPLDDKLALAVNNNWSFEYNITSVSVDWDVEWWVTINYVRCVGAVLSWVLFALCLGPDALQNHLISLLGLPKCDDRVIKQKNTNGNTRNG